MSNSRSTVRLPMKASSDWVKTAPVGATALIIAECMEKDRSTPFRRVTIDWLSGERTSVATLRAAATKLQDAVALAVAGTETERRDSDGSLYLSTSERCQTRWTIRSIPVGILTCWSGFEDGICPTEQPS